jgi:murein L,D-transpeptidase YafK
LKAIINIQLLVLLFLGFGLKAQQTQGFKQSQLKNSKVKQAYDSKWEDLVKDMKAKGIDPDNFDLFIRAFKQEAELEIWLKNKNSQTFTFLKKIPICATSGQLGPKRKEGDGQVPEGIYEISVFNPNSDYFLAVKVNYPNASDKILAKGPRAGGDIMIHGYCCTIGCIPLQNEPVKDLYILCVEARNRRSPIRVEIYPCKLNAEKLSQLKEKYSEENYNFWYNLKDAYTYFESNKQPVKYSIDKKGNYVFK